MGGGHLQLPGDGAAPAGSYGSRCVLSGDNFSLDGGSQARVVVNGAAAAVTLTQTATPSSIVPAVTSTIDLKMTNVGSMTLSQHDFSDLIPNGLSVVNGTSQWRVDSGGWTATSNPTLGSDDAYHWSISTAVAAGSSLELTFTVLAGNAAGAYSCHAAYASGVLDLNASNSWTPTDLGASLQLWLDADDASSVLTSGSQVTQWNDKSGHGRNAVQATPANQPSYGVATLSGMPAVSFSGAARYLDSPMPTGTCSQDYNVITVFQKTGTPQTYEALVTRGTANIGNPLDIYNDNRYRSATQYNGYTNIKTSTSPTLLVDTMDGVGLSLSEWADGSFVKSDAIGVYDDNGSTVCVGSRVDRVTQFNGVIGEVIVTNATLSTSDRQKLEGYLAWKWGLQGSLPADTPTVVFRRTVRPPRRRSPR